MHQALAIEPINIETEQKLGGKLVVHDAALNIVKNQKANSMAKKQAHLASSLHSTSF